MKQCKCGSYAFNLYKEDIDQGDLCDVHYWKEKALAQPEQGEPVATKDWEGAEYWMPLAWELCADECGEGACNELIWEGGSIPEPWGDRWLKYEDEAKRLIALVFKHTTLQASAGPITAEMQAGPTPEQKAQIVEVMQAPQQRTWVGLTDDERNRIMLSYYARTEPLAEAIEATLKEKNT